MATFALALVLALTPVKVTIVGQTHAPKINTHWQYSVHVTEGGKPVAARLSMQIIDPIGGHHAVQFGPSTKYVTNYPIKGVFHDYIIWPGESRGIKLRLHAIVKVGAKRYVANYAVTPRG